MANEEGWVTIRPPTFRPRTFHSLLSYGWQIQALVAHSRAQYATTQNYAFPGPEDLGARFSLFFCVHLVDLTIRRQTIVQIALFTGNYNEKTHSFSCPEVDTVIDVERTQFAGAHFVLERVVLLYFSSDKAV